MMRILPLQSRAGGLAALALATLGALALLGTLIQDQFGVFGDRSWPLPRAAGIKPAGMGFTAHLPPWGRGPLAERRATLLQNGKAVGVRVRHARTVVSRGNGAYKLQRNYLYFSLPRNADPRPVVGSLALSLPRPVNPAVWMAGAACLLIGGLGVSRSAPARQWLSTTADKVAAIPASLLVAGIFAGALATALAQLPDAMAFSDGCFSVKGVPHTDASGWDELAMNLAAGAGFKGGFSSQRPLYPAMLATIYACTGHSLLAAKVLNALWLAMAAAAVGALGILGGSRIAGLAGALAVSMSEGGAVFSKLLLTETGGTAFGVASVLALALALKSPGWWRIGLAALLLACANLTSGFGLFSLVGYGLVALVTWWRRQGFKRAVAQGMVLAGGVALAWLPWLLRQHAVHGIWNLATSNANLMYAAAAAEDGRLDPTIGAEWEAAGVPPEPGARYKFYMQKFAEAVKAHPAAYGRSILRGMAAFANYWTFTGPDRFGIVLLALIAVALARLRWQPLWTVLPASALLVGCCLALNGSTALLVWPLAAALALVTCSREQRPLWTLVALTAPFVALLGGVVGGHLNQRLWTASEWTLPLLLVRGGAGAMQILAGWIARATRGLKPPIESGESGMPAPGILRPATIVAVVLAAQAVLGSALGAGLYLARGGREPTPAAIVPPQLREQAMAAARPHYDFLAAVSPTDPRFRVSIGEFGEYLCHIDAWEDEQHTTPGFAVRPYARTVACPRMFDIPGGALITCELRTTPEKLPRGLPLLIVGVNHQAAGPSPESTVPMVEVLGFAPLLPGGTEPDWDRATWLPFTDEARDILRGGH